MPSSAVIMEVRDLVKHFRQVQAVKGVSFALKRGTCFGLLGPNGAGKTTIIEMLEGIHAPTSGEILYKGLAPDQRFREETGIMFQATALQDYLTVSEALQMFSQLYPRTLPLPELIAACALGEFLDRDTRRLSGGQRQRLLLAIALVNDPELIFLDEPTTGLDPQARRNFWELVKSIKARGKTLVLTTHYMDEAYVLCDEIAIMDHGRIIAQGTPDALLAAHFDEVILQLPRTALPDEHHHLGLTVIPEQENVDIPTRDVTATLKMLLAHDIPLTHLQIRARNLDDLFLQLTGKAVRV